MLHEAERYLREQLATAHHIIHMMGCDDLLATHISVRLPNTQQLLITPLNVPFEDISASNIMKSDLEGKPLSDNGHRIMPQATNIHASLYKENPNVMSAVHTHSLYGTAVSSLACGFLFSNQHSLRFYNEVAYHDLNGLALDNEGAEIAAALGGKSVLILRNHGLLTIGTSLEQAVYRMYYLERLCEMQIKTMAANAPLTIVPASVCEKTKAQYDSIISPQFEFEVLKKRSQQFLRKKLN